MARIEGTNAGERLIGTRFGDEILGRGGNDTLRGRAGDDNLQGNAGSDNLRGNGGSDTLRGGRGRDTLDGGGGSDDLRGNRDNDLFIGSRGRDTLRGGQGFDTANYGDLGELVTLQAVGVVDKGTAGLDEIRDIEAVIGAEGQDNLIDGTVEGIATSAFIIDLAAESLTVTNIPGVGNVTFTVTNFVDVIGTSNDDDITGDSNDNEFGGSEGNDTLDGGNGIDTVDYSDLGEAITLQRAGVIDKGSAGTDQIANLETIVGAVGFDNAIDGSTGISGLTSFDVDLSTQSLTVRDIPGLGNQIFTIENFVNVTGTSNADRIIGDGADNEFGGSEGNDTLDGGNGIDTVDYSDLGEAITLQRAGVIDKGSAGTDQIANLETIVGAVGFDNAIDGSTGISGLTSFDVDLSTQSLTVRDIPGLGDQTFTIENFVNVTGTSSADSIVGDRADNVLDGGRGPDTLVGGAGNDTLVGHGGRDRLIGVDPTSGIAGAGEIDLLDVRFGFDTIVLGQNSTVFYAFDGNDDFANIRGFRTGIDTIELVGSMSDYTFHASNTQIFFKATNDLIATFNTAFDATADFVFIT